MLARIGENRFPGCPIRTSGPIRPRAFAQAAQSGIYYGERREGNRSLTVAALIGAVAARLGQKQAYGRKSREEMYVELR
jgi:hypothetical protein